MKKLLLGAVMALTGVTASAIGPDIFNHLGAGVGVGLTGITVEAATPITPFVQMRAGVSIMPGIKFHVNADVDYEVQGYQQSSEVELTGDLGRVQGGDI